jgi:hypothetical protein
MLDRRKESRQYIWGSVVAGFPQLSMAEERVVAIIFIACLGGKGPQVANRLILGVQIP